MANYGLLDVAKPEDVSITPMTKPQFNKFCQRTAKAVSQGDLDYVKFEQELSEALVDTATLPERLNKLLSKFMDVLLFDLVPSMDKEKAQKSGQASYSLDSREL